MRGTLLRMMTCRGLMGQKNEILPRNPLLVSEKKSSARFPPPEGRSGGAASPPVSPPSHALRANPSFPRQGALGLTLQALMTAST